MLNALAKEILEINRANGWEVTRPGDWACDDAGENIEHRKIATVLALIHSEVSEALEAVRNEDYANFEEEMADVIIRVLDCTGGLGIDIDAVVRAKLEKNKGRGYRHGGKPI